MRNLLLATVLSVFVGGDFARGQLTTNDAPQIIALAGQFGYAPPKTIFGSRVALDEIRPAYIRSRAPKLDTNVVCFSANLPGNAVALCAITNPTVVMDDTAVLGCVTGEVRSCFTSNDIPNCFIRADPFPDTINSATRLSASEVTNILALTAERSQFTRARIRLPRNQPAQVFITGDGVDEDEIIGDAGTISNLPPHAIRSDQFGFRRARLPYAKFPRSPDLGC